MTDWSIIKDFLINLSNWSIINHLLTDRLIMKLVYTCMSSNRQVQRKKCLLGLLVGLWWFDKSTLTLSYIRKHLFTETCKNSELFTSESVNKYVFGVVMKIKRMERPVVSLPDKKFVYLPIIYQYCSIWLDYPAKLYKLKLKTVI